MLARFLMIAAVLFVVTGCSHKDDQAGIEQQPPASAEQSTGTAPLADAYGQNAAPGTEQDLVTNVGDRVFFDYDSYAVNDQSKATLQKQATWLQKYPNLNISIEGHCDERGTREYNLALGERRANAVKNYLVALGVPASRISTISYGKERPAVTGSDEASWSQNRRGVTVVQ